MMMSAVRKTWTLVILAALLAGCSNDSADVADVTVIATSGAASIKGEVWADNWFAFYLGERLIIEDSTPITTERSFNAEAFVFNADYPLQLNFVARTSSRTIPVWNTSAAATSRWAMADSSRSSRIPPPERRSPSRMLRGDAW